MSELDEQLAAAAEVTERLMEALDWDEHGEVIPLSGIDLLDAMASAGVSFTPDGTLAMETHCAEMKRLGIYK